MHTLNLQYMQKKCLFIIPVTKERSYILFKWVFNIEYFNNSSMPFPACMPSAFIWCTYLSSKVLHTPLLWEAVIKERQEQKFEHSMVNHSNFARPVNFFNFISGSSVPCFVILLNEIKKKNKKNLTYCWENKDKKAEGCVSVNTQNCRAPDPIGFTFQK